MANKQIYYSDKYYDDQYEYRHVMLPKELAKQVPKTHLMSEDEWRKLGVQQSLGWVHYMMHEPGWVRVIQHDLQQVLDLTF
ncbi:cyclin-dependent kinases regulatory subunit 2 isoform X1 [Scyliorhinus torazame]|uniref:cyclin-dependent kinases regulatory subunit 2 isoform X1 n=1 Tax=Scyliorhinus canicula TaxID=7830 RepID=UPI0018F78918|nr:cyclin-dependent kinases regulatory subunit 2 isoform X1 [Scyliorhinus canicula]